MSATLLSAALFIALDVSLREVFRARAIAFPSALAGMVGLFFGLVLANGVSPALGATAVGALSPGAALFTKWLPLFFVPSLVTLPLQPTPARADALRLLALTVLGWAASVCSTAALVGALERLSGGGSGGDQPIASSSTNAIAVAAPAAAPAPPPFKAATLRALSALSLAGFAAAWAAAGLGHPCAVPARTAFMLASAAAAFVAASLAPAAVKRLAHPVLVTAVASLGSHAALALALSWSSGALSGGAGGAWKALLATFVTRSLRLDACGAGDLLLFLLGPSIWCFAVGMFRQRGRMAAQAVAVAGATVGASLSGLFGSDP
jgi:putative effector of murein hydrolase LrgA (UPF0299 family)